MASPKLLVGSVVTVGTVSTAGVVVANQYGLFSTIGQVKREHIEEWIRTKSNGRAILELWVGEGDDEEKTSLEKIKDKKDLQKLFNCLKKNEKKFNGLTENKTLVFKKVNEEWKHIQKFIEDWVKEKSGSLDALKIKEGNESKPLSGLSDEDLKQLFYDLENHEKFFTVWKDEGESNKPALEFKKAGRIWKLIASAPKTIEIWVKATSNEKFDLKLWEEDKEKALSTISGSEELERILKDLGLNKGLFNNFVEGTGKKTLVFEKTDKGWKHIKAALREWLTKEAHGRFKIQIKKSDNSETDMNDADDNDLTGLLKHLNDSKSTYSNEGSSGKPTIVKFEKKTDGTNGWQKATS